MPGQTHGNRVVVTAVPGGTRLEGTIAGALVPGIVVEISPAVDFINGRPKYRVYTTGTDGNMRCILVLVNNHTNGQKITDAYADGDHCFLYAPIPGEELNMVIADVAGTGDTHAIGDVMIVQNATGKLIVTTGTPIRQPFQLLEKSVAPTADEILMCMFTGN